MKIPVDVTVIPIVFAIPPEEIVLTLTKIPSPMALFAFVPMVPLFTMPWPIVLFVTVIAALSIPPTKLGVIVPALLMAPERLEALTMIEVTVVFAGLLTEETLGTLLFTEIPPAFAGKCMPRRSAASEVEARSVALGARDPRRGAGLR
ncbi:MAG: hypothetical protein JO357_09515 [Hyphomicrobiales bacterium]|nr:hypothetical protein [Hyphomicrobiales bacterium]